MERKLVRLDSQTYNESSSYLSKNKTSIVTAKMLRSSTFLAKLSECIERTHTAVFRYLWKVWIYCQVEPTARDITVVYAVLQTDLKTTGTVPNRPLYWNSKEQSPRGGKKNTYRLSFLSRWLELGDFAYDYVHLPSFTEAWEMMKTPVECSARVEDELSS